MNRFTTASCHNRRVNPDRLLANLMLARGTLDRAAHLRGGEVPTTGVYLHIHDGKAQITEDDRLVWMRSPGDGEVYFLGFDDDAVAHFAVNVADEPEDFADTWSDLRTIGAKLTDEDAGAMTTAVALANWHANHPVCSKCGEVSVPRHAGWVRQCQSCNAQHFPRTDPAVIMLVVDDADRALLGRQRMWPDGFFSTLAGFVEPGESVEDAVRREVFEESHIIVGDVQYLGSQPWPFPCSLMLGCRAKALSTEIVVDDDELAQARWFSRDEVVAACQAGELRLPPAVSIARRLIEHWFGEELPDEWSRAPFARR